MGALKMIFSAIFNRWAMAAAVLAGLLVVGPLSSQAQVLTVGGSNPILMASADEEDDFGDNFFIRDQPFIRDRPFFGDRFFFHDRPFFPFRPFVPFRPFSPFGVDDDEFFASTTGVKLAGGDDEMKRGKGNAEEDEVEKEEIEIEPLEVDEDELFASSGNILLAGGDVKRDEEREKFDNDFFFRRFPFDIDGEGFFPRFPFKNEDEKPFRRFPFGIEDEDFFAGTGNMVT